RVALRGRDVDDLRVAVPTKIADPRGGIERGPNDRDGMAEHVNPAVYRRLLASTRDRAVLPDVVRHVAVETLVLSLGRRAREQELGAPQLLHAAPPVGKIDCLLELSDLPDRELAVRHRVLSDVRRRAF